MAQDTVSCPIDECDYTTDSPNALWSHFRMSARHENGEGKHSRYWNQKKSEECESGSGDLVQDMKENAKEEKESGIQKVKTPEKPSDEADYVKIMELETENLTEKQQKQLLAIYREGYEEIEDAPEKDIAERDVR